MARVERSGAQRRAFLAALEVETLEVATTVRDIAMVLEAMMNYEERSEAQRV
jgi:hypothetical protein